MSKQEIIIIADYSQTTALSLYELCDVCGIDSDFINRLIEHEIIHPRGEMPEEWEFELTELRKVKTVLRLQRDLEVNLAGAAVVLDLLEQLEQLQAQLDLIEKHFIPLNKHTG